ncbi:hypothetical protein AC579_10449 [Pseudocercospora musae]|uniref:Protein kinase domain-containing protein n=1 Tax=Pseudocercospora musae TaxID=113226 RepID=A0A139I036_9PEZI|nr:hypothetical protein AC579_10449 [Pseudocercospora musae]
MPEQSIVVLNQHIDEEDAVYRMMVGEAVGYVMMPANLFDEDTMCRPYLLIPRLPRLPPGPWTRVQISRKSQHGPLEVNATNDPLPAVESTWHQQRIDVLGLPKIKDYRSNVYEVVYQGEPAIAKIAAFDWDLQRIDRETWAYSVLDRYQRQNSQSCRIAARFLGHLTENDRVMGILLEKLEGQYASVGRLEACEEALRSFHKMGLVHGDVNRYNFIVAKNSGRVKLVDFEHAENFDEGKAHKEIESLASELSEQSGRGGSTEYAA